MVGKGHVRLDSSVSRSAVYIHLENGIVTETEHEVGDGLD